MQSVQPGKPWLLEICPASTLESLGLRKQYSPYKKTTKTKRSPELLQHNRSNILAELDRRGKTKISGDLLKKIVADPGGDALDSVIAAFETYRAVKNSTEPGRDANPDNYRREGYVYVQKDS